MIVFYRFNYKLNYEIFFLEFALLFLNEYNYLHREPLIAIIVINFEICLQLPRNYKTIWSINDEI